MNSLHLLGLFAVICGSQATMYDDLMADLRYLYNLDQLQNSLPLDEYYQDNSYDSKVMDDWEDVAYPDTLSDPKEPRDYGEAALRDQEYMKQLPLSGYQFISGGTGRQEDPSEVKTDKVLPAYCTPPNPCPFNYSGEDNCVKEFENSPDNNRRILEEQDCPCDAEHMLSCPPGKKTIDPKSGFVSDGMDSDVADLSSLESLENLDMDNSERFEDIFPYMEGEKLDQVNPNFFGQPKRVAAKKQASYNLNVK
ncbi:Neuroendocrine protein 7B2 [Mactra antiquata]